MLNGTIFLIFSACLVVYLIVLTIYFIKLRRHYNRLISFSGKESLGKILDTVLDKLSDNRNDIQALKKNIDELTETGRNHVQKVGIVRYNPFKDKGFDQSFILAILDNKDNGVVLTSIHNRNVTRWYAKNVRKGEGVGWELSAEERKAIKIAGLEGESIN